MKKSVTILIVGLILGFAAYGAFYLAGTAPHREVVQSRAPELLWLKNEFNLSQTEFERISALHEAYMPHCVEMCRRIDAKNEEIRALLNTANTLTPQIEGKLLEAAQLRVECQKSMLRHFYEVSQTMPAEQGRRYLAWVQERTFLPKYGMTSDK